MNGKDLAKLRAFCEENEGRIDIIMQTLSMAGFDDRVIDYVSGSLWSKRQAVIGLDLSDKYPVTKK